MNLYGLAHIPIGKDIDINFSARQFVENSSNNLKGFKFALNFIYDNLRDCHKDLLVQLKDFDLVIGHGIVGEAEAEILGKPFVTVSIAPMGLSKEYWKSGNMIKELGVFLFDKITGLFFSKPYMRYCNDVGVKDMKHKNRFPYLAMIPMPSFLQKKNPNWKEKTEITGYFFAPTPDDYVPSKELLRFISDGNKPLLVTFGSMFHRPEQTKKLYETICDSFGKSNTRAILIMPDINENEVAVPGNIFIAHQIPYSWLLDHVELVIHHFGFGTTAEVLRAGLPSIPVPHIFDQKIRATQVHKLGYAYKPLDINKTDSEILSKAIIQEKNDQAMKKKYQEAGNLIACENGIGNAAGMINEFCLLLNKTACAPVE